MVVVFGLFFAILAQIALGAFGAMLALALQILAIGNALFWLA